MGQSPYSKVVDTPDFETVMAAQDRRIQQLQRDREMQQELATQKWAKEQEEQKQQAGLIGMGFGLAMGGQGKEKPETPATPSPSPAPQPPTQMGGGGLVGKSNYLSPPPTDLGPGGIPRGTTMPGGPNAMVDRSVSQPRFMGMSPERMRSGLMGAQLAIGDYRGAGQTMERGLPDRRRSTTSSDEGILTKSRKADLIEGGFDPTISGLKTSGEKKRAKAEETKTKLEKKAVEIKIEKQEQTVKTERREINKLLSTIRGLGKAKEGAAEGKWGTAQEARLKEAQAEISTLLKDLPFPVTETKRRTKGTTTETESPESWWWQALGLAAIPFAGPALLAKEAISKAGRPTKHDVKFTIKRTKKINDKLLLDALRERAGLTPRSDSPQKPARGAKETAARPAAGAPAGASGEQEAVDILKKAGKPVTRANVDAVLEKMREAQGA